MHMWIYRWCGKGIDRYRYRFVCGCLFMISLPHFKNMEVFEDKVFFFPLCIISVSFSTHLGEHKRRKVGKKAAPAECLMFA